MNSLKMPMFNDIATQFHCQEQELIGICHPAQSDQGILIITGGPQYRIGSHRQFLLIARTLAKASYPVFRFDYRGMGDSSNEKEDISFTQAALDIITAIAEFKRLQPQIKKIILMGLCDGASAILIAIPHIKENISGIILINPWVYQDSTIAKTYLKYYYIRRLQESDFWIKLFKLKINFRQSLSSVLQKYRSAFLSKTDIEDPKISFIDQMFLGLLQFDGKILTLLSEDDLTAQEFQLLLKENKMWQNELNQAKHKSLILSNTNHTFSNNKSRQQVIDSIINWLGKL